MFYSKFCLRRFANIHDLINKKDWKSALALVESHTVNDQLDLSTRSSLIWGISNSGFSNEAYKLIQHLHQIAQIPNELEFTAVIEVCVRQGDIKNALNLLSQSENCGVSLDAAVYNEILTNGHVHLGETNLKYIFSCMKRDQIYPALNVCVSIIRHEI